ncbi:MAG: PIN domain-containing protein, partial [Beijerinckiaceae bacterium]
MVHLDTNIVIALLTGRNWKVIEMFDASLRAGETVSLSVLVVHELWFGVENSLFPRRNQERLDMFLAQGIGIETFDANDAAEAADIRAFLRRAGTPIGPYDLLIAAQARRRNAMLITANSRE